MLEMNAYLFLVSFILFSSVTVMASVGVLQLLSQRRQRSPHLPVPQRATMYSFLTPFPVLNHDAEVSA